MVIYFLSNLSTQTTLYVAFSIINPRHLYLNIDTLASKIISINGVEEVFVNDSNKGNSFNVQVRLGHNIKQDIFRKDIVKAVGNKFGYVINK